MNPSPTAQTIKYVGLDVHAQTVAVALAQQGGDVLSYGTIPAHSHSLDRLHKKLTADGAQVRYVYEAGPTTTCSSSSKNSKPRIRAWR